jgi:hypothetical protein
LNVTVWPATLGCGDPWLVARLSDLAEVPHVATRMADANKMMDPSVKRELIQ